MKSLASRTLWVLLLLIWCSRVMAQQESETEELAKKTQNPVADLISVPLQNNFNFGTGFNRNKTLYVLNIQPVIPVHLNDDWNLISRIIMSSKKIYSRQRCQARDEKRFGCPELCVSSTSLRTCFAGGIPVSKGVDQ